MTLLHAAREVAAELARTGRRVVFAESCTAGLVSAALARVPGVSQWHCGGVVTYRNETKAHYLGVPRALLESPGPVSEPVARLMAVGVLEKTPEADLAAAVTGHLGPNAPPDLDGVVYLALAERTAGPPTSAVRRLVLPATLSRYARQRLAAATVLEWVRDRLGGG